VTNADVFRPRPVLSTPDSRDLGEALDTATANQTELREALDTASGTLPETIDPLEYGPTMTTR
jgi:hypothetical protein